MTGFVGTHFIERGITHICHLMEMVTTMVVIDLERKDAEEIISVATQGTNTPFLPSPNLRRNVIKNRSSRQMLPDIFSHRKIEAWIVDKNHYLRLPAEQVALGVPHAAKDCRQMTDDWPDAHVSQVAIMVHQRSTLSLHQVATNTAELSFWLTLTKGSHEMGGMKVATGLSGNKVVFHGDVKIKSLLTEKGNA